MSFNRLLAFVVAVVFTSPALASASNFADTLRVRLNNYSDDPQLGELVRTVQEHTDDYEAQVQQALMNRRGLSLDVVLMAHEEWTPDGVLRDALVESSQARLMNLLNQQHYDVVGIEGLSDEISTFDALFQAAVTMSEQEYGYADTVFIKQNIELAKATNAGLRYMCEHPKAPTVGTEIKALNDLHARVLEVLHYGSRGPLENQELDRLQWTLSRARSFVAIARLINKLREVHGRRGCLTIGNGHEADVRQILAKYHIPGQIYDTSRS